MTPLTLDQLTVIIAAADKLGSRAFPRFESNYPCPDSERDYHVYFAMGAIRGYAALVEIAIAGLPDDLALEIRDKQVEGSITSLAHHVLNGFLPASAILDAFGEFLSRPGQALDAPGLVSPSVAPMVDEQPSLDQASVLQQCDVLGKHVGIDPRQEMKRSVPITDSQNHLPN